MPAGPVSTKTATPSGQGAVAPVVRLGVGTLLAGLLAVGLAGCGGDGGSDEAQASSEPAVQGPLEGVFVAAEATDAVVVLDPKTMRARRVISLTPPGGGERMPHQMAVTPDGKTLLVTEYGYGALAFYDLVREEVVAEVPVGGGPHGLALSPDGRFAYVAASQSGSIAVVDIAQRTRVAEVATHLLPWQIVLSPAGDRAWVTTQGDDTLAEIDLEAREQVRLLHLGEPYVVAAAGLPDGRLVVGGHSSNRLFNIDTAEGAVVDRPSLGGPAPTVAGADGSPAFSCQIAPSGGAMPIAFAARPGADELLAVNHGTDQLQVLTLPELQPRSRIDVGADSQGLAVSPDGRFAYVSAGGTGELWKVALDAGPDADADGGSRALVAKVGARPIGVLYV